jgi:hypothetical protein
MVNHFVASPLLALTIVAGINPIDSIHDGISNRKSEASTAASSTAGQRAVAIQVPASRVLTNSRSLQWPRASRNLRKPCRDPSLHISRWLHRFENATGIDFAFLDLNPTDPPNKRCEDQEAEGMFSQRLLLLGAKWWASMERYELFRRVYPSPYSYPAISAIGDGVEPADREGEETHDCGMAGDGGAVGERF